jgi:hypothetical protein
MAYRPLRYGEHACKEWWTITHRFAQMLQIAASSYSDVADYATQTSQFAALMRNMPNYASKNSLLSLAMLGDTVRRLARGQLRYKASSGATTETLRLAIRELGRYASNDAFTAACCQPGVHPDVAFCDLIRDTVAPVNFIYEPPSDSNCDRCHGKGWILHRSVDTSEGPSGACTCNGWLTSSISDMAKETWLAADRSSGKLDPGRLAVLADALEIDCGCDDHLVLQMLRGNHPCSLCATVSTEFKPTGCQACNGTQYMPARIHRYAHFWPLRLLLTGSMTLDDAGGAVFTWDR